MFLIQLLVPIADNDGRRFPETMFAELSGELSGRFGGLTAYTRSPAVGLWMPDEDTRPQRDDVIVYEVVTDELDRAWWSAYRATLQDRFRQDELMIRAHAVHRL